MATEKELHELVGRAVVDSEFRVKMQADPEQAAKEMGYELTTEQLTSIREVEGKGLAAVLEERLPKSLGIIY